MPESVRGSTDSVSSRRFRWRRWGCGLLLLLLVLISSGGLFYWWRQGRVEVKSDNAYVVGNITPISAEVTGLVVALYIDDNMIVAPGDPIAQIDPTPFQMEVDQALADFRQATSEAEAAEVTARFSKRDRASFLIGAQAKQGEAEQAVRAAEVMVQTRARLLQKDNELLASLQAQQPGLEALVTNAHDYYIRFNNLARTRDVPEQDRDNRETNYRDALAKLDALRRNIDAARRQVSASALQLEETRVLLERSRKTLASTAAEVGQAEASQLQPIAEASTAAARASRKVQTEARLRLARLNLSNTLIRAPQAGIISRRTIQLGQTVEAHRPFLSIVPLDFNNVWVVANLREDQMPRVRVGQPATITVDAIPERTFEGWVESVSGGTGTVFSLFPPDNATGNFVRVVQRLPVRIRFTGEENYQNRIRPGMSCRITVDTTRYIREGGQEW